MFADHAEPAMGERGSAGPRLNASTAAPINQLATGRSLLATVSGTAGELPSRSSVGGRSDAGLCDQLSKGVAIATDTAAGRGCVDRQFLRDVAAALRCLDDLDREPLELTYFGRMSIVEVAARTQVSTAEVARRMSRGLLRFQELFRQRAPEL